MEATPEQINKGRVTLRTLLPWARAEARKANDSKMTSALGLATISQLRESMLYSLVIYHAPLGGWHADVLFRGMPPGFPNAMGTPVGQPCRTFREAEEHGKGMLVALCRMAAQNEREKIEPKKPVFQLCGVAIELEPELYALALAEQPEGAGGPNGGYVSKEHAIERIEETIAEIFPAGVTLESAQALDRSRQARLMSVLHIASLTVVFRYPPMQDGSPSGHTATTGSVH
jgi:hypothetical protein